MTDNANGFNQNPKENGTNYENSEGAKLALYNDDINSFDFVILNLVEHCQIGTEQAEQLAVLAHYKGKTIIKLGSESSLRKICKNLSEVGLTVEVLY